MHSKLSYHCACLCIHSSNKSNTENPGRVEATNAGLQFSLCAISILLCCWAYVNVLMAPSIIKMLNIKMSQNEKSYQQVEVLALCIEMSPKGMLGSHIEQKIVDTGNYALCVPLKIIQTDDLGVLMECLDFSPLRSVEVWCSIAY